MNLFYFCKAPLNAIMQKVTAFSANIYLFKINNKNTRKGVEYIQS